MLVTVKSGVVVYPNKVPSTTTIPLTPIDCVMPRYPISGCFFFNNNTKDDISQVFDRLTNSLKQMLARHPELSGTLNHLKDESLAVACDSNGVEFTLAEGNFSLKDLEEINFAQAHLPLNMLQSKSAVMSAQLTSLTDSSIILGVSISHSVFDGCGFFNFIHQWAQLTKGESLGNAALDRVSLLHRFTPNVAQPSMPPSEYTIIHKSDGRSVETNFQLPKMSSANLTVSVEKLRKYRDAQHINGISVNDVLCAVVWRSVIRARQTSADSHVKFGMAVDGRSRMNPTLSTEYFGNVNYWIAPISEVKTVLTSSIAEVALLIRAAVNTIDQSHIDLVNQWISGQPDKSAILPGFSQFLGPDFAVTSWAKFPIYQVDFGWGSPVKFRVPTREFDGLALIFPTDHNCDLEITVGLKVEQLQMFLTDPEMQMFQV